MKIEEEIQQKTFQSEYQKVSINLLFTASWLSSMNTEALKPFNISWQQFNILRILRGRNPKPATVKLLSERMIDKMSNASRLVEKLRNKGLVERTTCEEDRRQVNIIITPAGLELIAKASEAIEANISHILRTISPKEAKQLNGLLDKIRG
ncbi:MAG: MarR family transcriptional regulator [Bacteroidota bacterium]